MIRPADLEAAFQARLLDYDAAAKAWQQAHSNRVYVTKQFGWGHPAERAAMDALATAHTAKREAEARLLSMVATLAELAVTPAAPYRLERLRAYLPDPTPDALPVVDEGEPFAPAA